MYTPIWAILPILVVITYTNGHDIHCNGGTVTTTYIQHEIIDKNCNYVRNSLIIADMTVEPGNLGDLNRIKHIDGSLIIRNTSNLKSISLSKVRSIGNWKLDEPAIQIHDNTGLKNIVFKSLVSLRTRNAHDVVIVNNPDLSPDVKKWLTSITHPARIDDGIDNNDKYHSKLHIASHALAIATLFAIIAALVIGIVIALLRRQYNKHIENHIDQPLPIIDDINLNDEQKNRLLQYTNQVLHMTVPEWKNLCDHVICQPVKDPTYHRKPTKNNVVRIAEAQLKYMNIPLKKRRNPAHIAKLPDNTNRMTRYISERMKQISITEHIAKYSAFNRTLDADNNLVWSGDLYAASNKIFIGNVDGKILRRELPTNKNEERIFRKREDGMQMKTICREIFFTMKELIGFQLTIRRECNKSKRHRSHTFKTTCFLYTAWPDNGFPRDMGSVLKLILSIASDTRRSTIIVGKSTDASCELFWMMNVVVKAILGRATSANLVSILEACIILLKPEYLTSTHFLYLLRFVLALASSVGLITDEQRETVRTWRTDYYNEEMKADARLYGRAYLRVIDLEQVDVECDEVLAELNRTFSASAASSVHGRSEADEEKSKTPAQKASMEKQTPSRTTTDSPVEPETKPLIKKSTNSTTPKKQKATSSLSVSPRLESNTQEEDGDDRK